MRYNDNFTDIINDEEYAKMLHFISTERENIYPFLGDSRDYYVLNGATLAVKDVPGLICEIGLRRGGGTKAIMDAVIQTKKARTIISIDPFGSIPFEGMEGEKLAKTEYSNAMQKETLEKMYRFLQEHPKINYIFFPMEDTEFFKRFADGVPVYVKSTKKIVNKYALVHFDGPHTLAITMDETKFFLDKTHKGSIFVYDDVSHFYDHEVVKTFLLERGWAQTETSQVKASYLRIN